MTPSTRRLERLLLGAAMLLLAIAVVAPPLAQPADHHAFADQRLLWGVPFAMDVLSNLPFALAGAFGLWHPQRRGHAMSRVERRMCAVFFAGLLVTAAGSTYYHLRPDDAGLAIDRAAMVIAFAGVVGLAVATRAGSRAANAAAVAVFAAGLAAVLVWFHGGNVTPWAVVQFGGMLVIACMAVLRALPGALAVRWLALVGIYAVAKAFEINDHAVYEFTRGWLSGHSVKHVVAACAAIPVIGAVSALHGPLQNARRALARA